MIRFNKINKIYKKRSKEIYALKDFSYCFKDTGFYAVTGQSGSGKSTLLNILTFLDFPSNGEVEFNGQKINYNNTIYNDYLRKRSFSIVYEENNFLENETLLNNLSTFLSINHLQLDENKLYELMEFLNLRKNLLDQKIGQLSGGEKKRANILRALLINNPIIVMDEPTSELDYENAEEIFLILKKLSKEKLIIISTHDTKFANKYCDEKLTLDHGNLINPQTEVIVEEKDKLGENETIISPSKGKFAFNSFVLKSILKSNALLYFVLFCFLLIFSIGTEWIMSSSVNNATIENVQKAINNSSEHFSMAIDCTDVIESDVAMESLSNIISENFSDSSYANMYYTSNYFSFLPLNDDGSTQYFLGDVHGDLPKSENELLIDYSEARYIQEKLDLDSIDDVIGQKQSIKVGKTDNVSPLEFTIVGYYIEETINTILPTYIASNNIYNLLKQYNIEYKVYCILFNLKGDTLIKLSNTLNLNFDTDIFEINEYTYDLSFTNPSLPSFIKSSKYRNTYETYLIFGGIAVVISLVFLILILYSIISKNKETIILYRTLGFSFKESLAYHLLFSLSISVLAFAVSLPITSLTIYLIGSVDFSNFGKGFDCLTVSHQWSLSIISFIIVLLLVFGITYLLLHRIYRKKRIIKL